MNDGTMTARGPYPLALAELVGRMRAYPGWAFRLEHGTYDDGQVEQLRLIITVRHHNSYRPLTCAYCSGPIPSRATQFHYPVPMVTFDRSSWLRWLRDRVADVHVHEDGEAIAFEYEADDGQRFVVRPFAPFHGPGRDPNRLVEVGIDPMEQRILQDGSQAKGDWIATDYVIHDDAEHALCIERSTDSPGCTPIQVLR